MSVKRSTRSSSLASTSTSDPPSRPDHMLPLSELNPYITCPICDGYFVEATTVIDCLHTFCKSCLLKHFEENTDCPKCHFMIHQSHPSHYVAFDRTMQDIVYKLVPGMQAEEIRRRADFYNEKYKIESNENGVHEEFPIEENLNSITESDECCNGDQLNRFHHRIDHSLAVQLVSGGKLENVQRSFVRISELATINTVKRLLAYLLLNDITRYNEFDIFCNNELMGRDYSVAFIHKTRWRNRTSEPLMLIYKEHIEF
ncbi:zinc finger, c3HC4 type (RING finger) domain-containing protein [Ditylenchus destructor]|nr:zinc finger, c3HC4 type (RING finger) domain-containing protein [Ditylenchus destructor]